MIKLLKYDWKRSSDGILSTLAILIIVEAVLTVIGVTRNWNEAVLIGLSIFGYIMALVLLFIHCFRTFDGNIKSYSRRLLPLHPIHGIGATILLGWAIMLTVTIIASIHIPLFLAYSGIDIDQLKEFVSFQKDSLIGLAITGLWMYTTFMIVILCSITVARSFRMKHNAWIGIVFFFATQTITSWISYKFFDQNENAIGFISINEPQTNENAITFASTLNMDFLLGPFLLDTAFMAGYVLLMIYLLKKKVEL